MLLGISLARSLAAEAGNKQPLALWRVMRIVTPGDAVAI